MTLWSFMVLALVVGRLVWLWGLYLTGGDE